MYVILSVSHVGGFGPFDVILFLRKREDLKRKFIAEIEFRCEHGVAYTWHRTNP